MANFRSFGDENLAKAEAATGGAVLAEFQKKRNAARAQVARIPPNPLPPPLRRMTPADERAQAEIMSVALKQPHRRGEADPRDERLATPLGRFCRRMWRNDSEMRHACFCAGNDYARDVRAYLVACGHNVPGVDSIQRGGSAEDLTPEAIETARLAKEAAKAIVDRANEVLIDVEYRLPRAMERLCCSLDEPYPCDEGILQTGLRRLAAHYELI